MWSPPEAFTQRGGKHKEVNIKILQVNTNRSKAALDLLEHTIMDQMVDVALVAEPNRIRARDKGWLLDSRGDTAIKVANRNIKVRKSGVEEGYTWVETDDGLLLCACYHSPNKGVNDLELYLNDIQKTVVARKPKRCLVAGDLNAKAYAWDPQREDEKGKIVTEWMAEMELNPANEAGVATFARADQTSILDITLHDVRTKVTNWRVVDEENLSDHKTIMFEVETERGTRDQRGRVMPGWVFKETQMKRFIKNLEDRIERRNNACTAGELQDLITQSCNVAFSKKCTGKRQRKATYWWNQDIAELRSVCNRARRGLTRGRASQIITEQEKEQLREAYKQKRKDLTSAIKQAKWRCWKELIDELDNDIWGRAYQIVRQKYKTSFKGAMTDEDIKTEAQKLFPQNRKIIWTSTVVGDFQPFTAEELKKATQRLKKGKAPGPDGLTNEVIKLIVETQGEHCLKVYNRHINEGTFPKIWKDSKLVLIEKPKKQDGEPTAFRPICLINNLGKLYERLINQRLLEELDQKNIIHDAQYGFRKGRSTIDAMKNITKIAEKINSGPYQRRKFCVLVCLDIKNAFNSVPWRRIVKAVEKRRISPYLVRVIKAYLSNRSLMMGDSEMMDITCGVPQGSVLGPTLWNIFYDEVLRIRVPDGVKMIAYADDLALVVEGISSEEIKEITTIAIKRVTQWMTRQGLSIAQEKTETVMLVGRRKIRSMSFEVAGRRVDTQESVKYLGVVFERNMRMMSHVKHIQKRATKIMTDLSRLMYNINGPRSSKRRLLVSAVMSVLLYATPVWGREAIKYARYKRALQRVQRMALLRMARAYRTVSDQALCVISGVAPVHLLIEERTRVYEEGQSREIKEETEVKWQEEWDQNEGKGLWTKRLIPEIKDWKNRTHGELTYAITQMLTGHGCFREYLHKFKKAEDSRCPYCGETDSAEHTFFVCPKWNYIREGIEAEIGERVNTENVVPHMLESERKWDVMSACWSQLIQRKEEDERELEGA